MFDKTKYKEYVVTDNFRTEDSPAFKGKIIRRVDLETNYKDMHFDYDERLLIASHSSTKDDVQYFNYFNVLMRNFYYSSSQYSDTALNRTMGLLDAGFVPAYAPPTFFELPSLRDRIIEHAKKYNIRYIEEPQYSVEGRVIHNGIRDVWVSRMDICDKLGQELTEFDFIKYIKDVIKG